MKHVFNSLTFKIGAIIILAEIVTLTVVGTIYIKRFAEQVDRRIVTQAQLPGLLMNAGLLDFGSIADRRMMRQLVGEELLVGLVAGVNRNVFYSLDNRHLGQDVADIPGVDIDLFHLAEPHRAIVRGADDIVIVSPIFAADRQTPRFFVYIRVDTSEAAAEKAHITRLFIAGSLVTLLVTSVIILLSFDRLIFRQMAGLLHVLRRFEAGDANARVTGVIVDDEIGTLQRSVNTMISARQQAEEQSIHLNRILRAIRSVNQLITQERDLDRLLERACCRLTEVDSYASAWIMLLDDEGIPVKMTRNDAEGHTFPEADLLAQAGSLPCLPNVLTQPEVQVIGRGAEMCRDCVLSAAHGPHNVMAVRLEFEGKIYGMLHVSVLPEYIIDAEESSLFDEVAGDLSFALYSLDLEAGRQQAEEQLKQYSGQLEEMVEERSRELLQVQRQLLQQEKLAVIGRLAGRIAHELRHPLGVLSNSAYFLKMTLADSNESTREYLTLMMEEIQRADTIISELLDFSQTYLAQEVAQETCDIPTVISQVLSAHPAPEGIVRRQAVDEGLPPIVANAEHLRYVLNQLLLNAYQAMPAGGQVTIGTAVEGGHLALSVTDTGEGIPQEKRGKLFEALFTTKARGIGLGLTICKNLVEANRGNIDVTSEEGEGSTFTLRFPIVEQEVATSNVYTNQ